MELKLNDFQYMIKNLNFDNRELETNLDQQIN